MTARLRLVSSTAHPGRPASPRVQIVSECAGRRWVASPRLNTVYVLAGSPEQVGRAVTEAMAALAARRPQLATVGGAR